MAAALVAGTVLAGTGVADAAVGKIPKNFLLTEVEARKPLPPEDMDEAWWTISDRLSRPLELNPCRTKRKRGDGRVSMRTITYLTSAPHESAEQLVVHRNATYAHAAFRKLQADLKRCRLSDSEHRYGTRSVRVGSEAMLVGYQSLDKGRWVPHSGWRYIVARRGSALFLYKAHVETGKLGRPLTGPAKRMAVKVCRIRGVCGS